MSKGSERVEQIFSMLGSKSKLSNSKTRISNKLMLAFWHKMDRKRQYQMMLILIPQENKIKFRMTQLKRKSNKAVTLPRLVRDRLLERSLRTQQNTLKRWSRE